MPKEEAIECENCRRMFCEDHVGCAITLNPETGATVKKQTFCGGCFRLKYGEKEDQFLLNYANLKLT